MAEDMPAANIKEPEQEPISMVEFLENRPPGSMLKIADLMEVETYSRGGTQWRLHTPPIHLYCDSPECSGPRYYRYSRGDRFLKRDEGCSFETFITYICSNCGHQDKIFSLFVEAKGPLELEGRSFKFGELPPFGPVTPSRLLKMLGDNRDLFMKGRRCESQSLGIGAFGYYRRVVENQRAAILGQIVNVAKTINAPAQMVELLQRSQAENQFSKSLEMVKDAIPESLRIQGHNPLTLLHDNLSTGLHARSDGECLEVAGAVRVVLAELAERITAALKDEAELTKALGKLFNKDKVIDSRQQ
jgi:hypothetical protein